MLERKFTLSALILLTQVFIFAQSQHKRFPLSQDQHPLTELKTEKLKTINLQKILEQDASGIAYRFSAPIQANLNLENAGKWVLLDNGDAVWRLKIQSPGAKGLAILYDQFYLPAGASLFLYDPAGKKIIGPFGFEDNLPTHKFITGFLPGEEAILEYYEPKSVLGQGKLQINRIDHAYRSDFLEGPPADDRGFGASLDCNLNAACDIAHDWSAQRKGVCRILVVVEEGIGYCSGTLMNNTNSDGKPYILTAFHCQDGFTPMYDMWRFDFNYESAGCENPLQEPGFYSVMGATLRAGRQQSDFLLLECIKPIPNSIKPYFNGWNRSTSVPSKSSSFHHPLGDIKKVSIDTQKAVIYPTTFNWNNGVTTPPMHHFQVQFDYGTYQGGSSGSPLFNQDGLVVGQLHGGSDIDKCSKPRALYGRLFQSWDGGGSPSTRLKDWLDPGNTGAMSIPGMEPISTGFATLQGLASTENGMSIPGIEIQLITAADTQTTFTAQDGTYAFDDVPLGEPFQLLLTRVDDERNGVSTLDLIQISKHILSVEKINSPYKLLAADIDQSGSLSIIDLIKIRKVILSIDQTFVSVPNWLFFPADHTFENPENPYNYKFPDVFMLDAADKSINFVGIKSGDVNASAEIGG